MKRTDLRAIMQLAWQFVKRNGIELAEALKRLGRYSNSKQQWQRES